MRTWEVGHIVIKKVQIKILVRFHIKLTRMSERESFGKGGVGSLITTVGNAKLFKVVLQRLFVELWNSPVKNSVIT